MKTLSSIAVLLSLGSVFAACGSDDREVMTPASQVAPRSSPLAAVEQIAAARCDREARCNEIGPTKKYQTREHCMQVMRADAADDFDDDDCPNGIGDNDLRECLSDVSSQNCGGMGLPFEKLETTMSCREDNLCLD